MNGRQIYRYLPEAEIKREGEVGIISLSIEETVVLEMNGGYDYITN